MRKVQLPPSPPPCLTSSSSSSCSPIFAWSKRIPTYILLETGVHKLLCFADVSVCVCACVFHCVTIKPSAVCFIQTHMSSQNKVSQAVSGTLVETCQGKFHSEHIVEWQNISIAGELPVLFKMVTAATACIWTHCSLCSSWSDFNCLCSVFPACHCDWQAASPFKLPNMRQKNIPVLNGTFLTLSSW